PTVCSPRRSPPLRCVDGAARSPIATCASCSATSPSIGSRCSATACAAPSVVRRLIRVDDTALPEVDFEDRAQQAIESLPPELRDYMSNVAIFIEYDAPGGTHP